MDIKDQAKQLATASYAKIESDASLKDKIQKILDFLPACEYELITYMVKKKVWSGPVPEPPKNYTPGDGSIELGLFLYWFHNPDQLDLSEFSFHAQLKIYEIIAFADFFVLPNTLMTKVNYDFFKHNELIYTDGSVLGTEKFANFDQGWFVAFVNLFITFKGAQWYNKGIFPSTTPAQVDLKGATPDTVKIAIIGDWGAGNEAAKAVMKDLETRKPDYIIHVGDTYYAGTPAKSSPFGDTYLSPGEELENLNNLWPSAYNNKSFTLNSNHEMYSGANGLFCDALGADKSPVGSGTPFASQAGASCFALKFGGWTLLGLDSAYNASTFDAFMTGSLGSSIGFQTTWIKSLNLDPNKTIVFTHHNGFADDTTYASPLWAELRSALNGDPFAWYWGHVHNGIVYDRPITIPTKPKHAPGFKTYTYARCLGHASLPYGPASALAGKCISYQVDSMQPAPSKELYNGYAIITLKADGGALNSIYEAFYDIGGKNQPPYSKQLL